MRRLILSLLLSAACFPFYATTGYADSLRVQGTNNHVQGIAYDRREECFYCSFTTAFFKVATDGRIIGSIDNIHGHLGAMTFDPQTRKVYASLECKDDEIGRGISRGMGVEAYGHDESRFYIAEIDVDSMTMETHELPLVREDYLAGRFACSGIDGVTLAPAFGRRGVRARRYLYVAYGIYGDTTRTDNDYNVLLCYRPGKYDKPVRRYFVRTGNTTYGVQNLCYDSSSGSMLMAVYRGRKKSFHNYSLFSLDMSQKPFKAPLQDVPYCRERVWQLGDLLGSDFPLGSTGICSLGDGLFYIGVHGREDGREFCDFKLYKQSGSDPLSFERPHKQ